MNEPKKQNIKVISAKIPEELYAECEKMREKMRTVKGTATLNEIVMQSLILYLCAYNDIKEGVTNSITGSQEAKT